MTDILAWASFGLSVIGLFSAGLIVGVSFGYRVGLNAMQKTVETEYILTPRAKKPKTPVA